MIAGSFALLVSVTFPDSVEGWYWRVLVAGLQCKLLYLPLEECAAPTPSSSASAKGAGDRT